MEMDPQNNRDGDGSVLKLKLAESELAMLVASQEADRYKKECMLLKETVSRLEEDRHILRKREQKDAQTISNLLGKLERNEQEFSDKLAELTMRNWDLECALSAKGGGYGETEKGMSESVKEEDCRVTEKEEGFQNGNVNELQSSDEMPDRAPVQKRDFVVIDSDGDSDDDEDGIQLSQLSKKRVLDAAENDSGSSLDQSFDRMAPCEFRSRGVKETSAGEVETQIPKGTKELSAKEVQAYPKRNVKNQNSQRAYTRRIASIEQKTRAVNGAKFVQRNLISRNPSCHKQMTPSNVSGSFWLNLPTKFCKEYLPDHEHRMILEDEKGLEYEVKYICSRTALSGGWRGFAIAHNLELDDVIIFELCEPARFKIYIIKAVMELTEDIDDKIAAEYMDGPSKMSNNIGYGNQDVDLSDFNTNLQNGTCRSS